MWHQLIYKYCMSCHIHPLFLYAGKSEPSEKSSAGLAPPTPQLCAGNSEIHLQLQVARGAWIQMLCSISYAVYIKKLERVCVSRHRWLEDKVFESSWEILVMERLSFVDWVVVVMPWSPTVKVFTGAKLSAYWFILKLEMGDLNKVLINGCMLPFSTRHAE